MGVPLRALIVSGSIDLIGLIQHELHRSGYDPTYRCVSSKEEMLAALLQEQWDVVISEFTFDQYEALDGLVTVFRHDPDLPFIILSETTGEEAAVAAIRAGAGDYISKANLRRLGPAVERELRESHTRRQCRHMESALRQTRAGYRQMVGAVTDYFFTVEVQEGQAVKTIHGPACVAVTGYESSDFELDQFLWVNMVHEEDRDAVRTLAEDTLAGREVFPIEHRILRKDGSVRLVRHTPIRHYDAEGKLCSYDGLIQDVTERRYMEAEQRRLSRAVAATGDAVMLTDCSGCVVHVNPAFERITGYDFNELVGCTPEFLSADDYKALCDDESAATDETRQGRVEARRKDGSYYHAALTVSPVKSDTGELEGFVTVHREVTEQVERERQLSRQARALIVANSKLENQWRQMQAQQQQLVILNKELENARALAVQASQAKSEFLATMSHEIRTPMTAILGFAENLLDTDLPVTERLDAVQTIRRNGQYLLEIINDILDISKIEAGKLEVEKIEFSPYELLEEIRLLMQVRADEKGLYLDFEYDGEIPHLVRSDPMRLKQILINLVGNGIKFTHCGGVKLLTRVVPDELTSHIKETERLLEFSIIDTGIGMTREQVNKLFGTFAQADKATTRKYGGSGLGLAISKRLSNVLGGDIIAESEHGMGSVFRATVLTEILSNNEHAEANCNRTPGQRGSNAHLASATLDCRVLLAEDGPDNQRLISFVLRKAGAEVVAAENGKEAVDLALEARDAGCPFDVVLMDIQMPVMDGYEATRNLREAGYTGSIIALTAHAMATTRQKCRDAGCDAHASKPIDRNYLISLIAKSTNATSSMPEEDALAGLN